MANELVRAGVDGLVGEVDQEVGSRVTPVARVVGVDRGHDEVRVPLRSSNGLENLRQVRLVHLLTDAPVIAHSV